MLLSGYVACNAVKDRTISSRCQSEAAQELKALGICKESRRQPAGNHTKAPQLSGAVLFSQPLLPLSDQQFPLFFRLSHNFLNDLFHPHPLGTFY